MVQLERAEALLVGHLLETGEARAAALAEEACTAAGVAAIWMPCTRGGSLHVGEHARDVLTPMGAAPLRELLLPMAPPYPELAPVAALLRDRCSDEQRVTLLALGPHAASDEEWLTSLNKFAGIRARVAAAPACAG